MQKKKGTHLGKMLVAIFLVSGFLAWGVYAVYGFEVALLTSICWLTAVIAASGVGIENTINQKD